MNLDELTKIVYDENAYDTDVSDYFFKHFDDFVDSDLFLKDSSENCGCCWITVARESRKTYSKIFDEIDFLSPIDCLLTATANAGYRSAFVAIAKLIGADAKKLELLVEEAIEFEDK